MVHKSLVLIDADQAVDIKYYKNHIYVTGYTRENFNGVSLKFRHSNQDKDFKNYEFFLLKIDLNGNHVFTKITGTPGNNGGTTPGKGAIEIGNDFIYVAGTIGNNADSSFISKFDLSGNELWNQQVGIGNVNGIKLLQDKFLLFSAIPRALNSFIKIENDQTSFNKNYFLSDTNQNQDITNLTGEDSDYTINSSFFK